MRTAFHAFLAAALACCGCMTHTSTRIPSGGPSHGLPGSSVRANDIGEKRPGADPVRVDVFEDGRLEIYRTAVTRERLLRRLAGEERGDNLQGGVRMTAQRPIVLRAQKGVRRETLEELRAFLVRNGIPNVSLATGRNVSAGVGPAVSPPAAPPPPQRRR